MPRGKKRIEETNEAISATPEQTAETADKPKRGRKKNAVSEQDFAQTKRKAGDEANEAPSGYLAVICETIGANIRMNRKLRKFSIDNLADYLELSSSYVGLLERGERCPSLKTLLKISEFFGMNFGELLAKAHPGNAKQSQIAEPRKSTVDNKQKSIISLLHRLDEPELEFIISMLKAMRSMNKSFEMKTDEKKE